MIQPYDPNNSPTNLSRRESRQLASGRKELGVRNLGRYSVDELVTAGARRRRGVALTGIVSLAAFVAAGTFGGPSNPSHEQHNADKASPLVAHPYHNSSSESSMPPAFTVPGYDVPPAVHHTDTTNTGNIEATGQK